MFAWRSCGRSAVAALSGSSGATVFAGDRFDPRRRSEPVGDVVAMSSCERGQSGDATAATTKWCFEPRQRGRPARGPAASFRKRSPVRLVMLRLLLLSESGKSFWGFFVVLFFFLCFFFFVFFFFFCFFLFCFFLEAWDSCAGFRESVRGRLDRQQDGPRSSISFASCSAFTRPNFSSVDVPPLDSRISYRGLGVSLLRSVYFDVAVTTRG